VIQIPFTNVCGEYSNGLHLNNKLKNIAGRLRGTPLTYDCVVACHMLLSRAAQRGITVVRNRIRIVGRAVFRCSQGCSTSLLSCCTGRGFRRPCGGFLCCCQMNGQNGKQESPKGQHFSSRDQGVLKIALQNIHINTSIRKIKIFTDGKIQRNQWITK